MTAGLGAGCSLVVDPALPGEQDGAQCLTHADCRGGADIALCGAGGQCVRPLTARCSKYVGPIEQDRIVVVGSIMPTIGDFSSIGLPIERALELAVEEINDSGGLPGGRRLVMIECDSSGSRSQGLEVAEHLVDGVGVPMIFGPAFSSIFIDVTTLVTAQAGVMTMSPSASSATIGGLDDGGLGWRTVASDAFQGVAMADLVRRRGFSKVIALGKDDAYGKGLLDEVSRALAGELGEDAYFSLTFDDPGDTPTPDFAGVVTAALDEIPDADAMILLGTTEIAEILSLVETRLREVGSSTVTSMRYVMPDGGKTEETLTLAREDESLIARIEGTEADHRPARLYDAFALRFQQAFGELPGIYAANAYDAVYLAAYAMSALPRDMPVTGPAVAEAMASVSDDGARAIEAGPSGINDARNTLSAGGTIDYAGASGPLDFDLERGEAPANVARWVVEKRANGELRFISDGLYTVDGSGGGEWALSE